MDPQVLQQIVERLQQANTIMITVSRNPSLDQLAACIGMTLFINKLNKHGAAVFSGQIPPVLDFLNPEETIEGNTDSLRDFIISLDKAKADKLRYKVEGDVVKIFITPYRTSLAANDFDFSQGDFNVEAVVALGVMTREDLDEAILAHGRILHDATVIGVSVGDVATDIGSINLHDDRASGLSEMAARICAQLDPDGLDDQIATSLLTGLVAQTDRFRNQNTSPRVMQLAAQLMAAGANQQLVADELEKPEPPAAQFEEAVLPEADFNGTEPAEEIGEQDDIVVNDDGSMSIAHDKSSEFNEEVNSSEPAFDVPVEKQEVYEQELPVAEDEPVVEAQEPVVIEETQVAGEVQEAEQPTNEQVTRERIEQQPKNTGQLTANTEPERVVNEPSTDAMSFNLPPKPAPIMTRGKTLQPLAEDGEGVGETQLPEPVEPIMQPESLPSEPAAQPTVVEEVAIPPAPSQAEAVAPSVSVPAPVKAQPNSSDTLADIEKLIGSAHAMTAPKVDQEAARATIKQEAETAKALAEPTMKPIEALNATPALENLNSGSEAAQPEALKPEVKDPNSPPEVPPPIVMTPQFFDPSGQAEAK